ncbi:MAG: hypothetical protein WHU94_15745 [Thermogemmata sp.]|uniref:EGF-like domain-containing protein n=1 Tax=Thermogemmata fonticola TaxID=2755323 RepID=A0A7V8VDG1_9BACT|nr:hypothetical protein [Thermogemmata fonticola]MBA2225990.1 hypothetical protein [Thermogemmata fonticola]
MGIAVLVVALAALATRPAYAEDPLPPPDPCPCLPEETLQECEARCGFWWRRCPDAVVDPCPLNNGRGASACGGIGCYDPKRNRTCWCEYVSSTGECYCPR